MEAGAICVDMECSAVAALAAFRDFELSAISSTQQTTSRKKMGYRTLSSRLRDLDERRAR